MNTKSQPSRFIEVESDGVSTALSFNSCRARTLMSNYGYPHVRNLRRSRVVVMSAVLMLCGLATTISAQETYFDNARFFAETGDEEEWLEEEEELEGEGRVSSGEEIRNFAQQLMEALIDVRSDKIRSLCAESVLVRGEPVQVLGLGLSFDSQFRSLDPSQVGKSYQRLAGRIGHTRWNEMMRNAKPIVEQVKKASDSKLIHFFEQDNFPTSIQNGDYTVVIDVSDSQESNTGEVFFVVRRTAGQLRVVTHDATYYQTSFFYVDNAPKWLLWTMILGGVIVIPYSFFWSGAVLRTGKIGYVRTMYGNSYDAWNTRRSGMSGERSGLFAYVIGLVLLLPLLVTLVIVPWGVGHLWIAGVSDVNCYMVVFSLPFIGWMIVQAVICGLSRLFG